MGQDARRRGQGRKSQQAMDGSDKSVDVLIGGGGFAGLSLAIALRQALGAGFAVAVVDPALERGGQDGRASAIAAAARRLFETLGAREGLKFLHVPYKGIAPVVTAVMTGEVSVSVASPAAAGSMLKAGKVRALAVGGSKRSGLFPYIPTLTESGYPYIDAAIWWGIFAPAGISAKLVDQINHDVANVAKQPDFVEKYLTAFGLDPVLGSPQEFAAAIASDVKATAEMVEAAGVKPVE